MKRIFTLIIVFISIYSSINAQKRVIDAIDHSPVSAASIFDSAGNMIGYTWNDGLFSDISDATYPITIRCMGYEQLVIEQPEDKTWEMHPIAYELEEVVVIPVKRNILKQTFYIREYFSMSNDTDTITFFMESMANRFLPTSKDAKFGGNSKLRILDTHQYGCYKLDGKDSIVVNPQSPFPSMLSVLDLNNDEVIAPASFNDPNNTNKIYEKSGKSGMALIQKQNAQTFTTLKDALAYDEGHTYSPAALKLLGCTMVFNQLFTTHVYRVNDKGIYLPKDLIEAGFVMEADGRGKYLRMSLNSKQPVLIRYMIELYVIDRDYLSKEEAKDEYKHKPTKVKFEIPSSVPPLNEATQRMVELAHSVKK